MGWLSWLFPTEADRLDKARRYLERGEPHHARDEVEGLGSDEARAVHAEALRALMRLNVREAIACAEGGSVARAQEHLSLAEQFSTPGDPEMAQARRAVREARQRRLEEREAATGPEVPPEGDDPLYALPPNDPRLRFAMVLEGYPEDLRARLTALGPGLAAAVMAVEEGQVAEGLDALRPFAEREPAARFERGRAAVAAGVPALVVTELRAFGAALGHQRVGAQHSAVMLAEALGALGMLDEARAELEAALRQDPDDLSLGLSRALVLEAQGLFAECDEAARGLASRHPRQLALYKLMARVRLRGGKRAEAAAALEAGLGSCCASGKCGMLPFDPEVGRQLARIYLEDRVEPERAAELLRKVDAAVQEPEWVDAYLHALAARNSDAPDLGERVQVLARGLGPDDPRRAVLHEAFGVL